MNKTNKLNELATERARKSMGFESKHEAANYMWGYYRGLLNHLERQVPGVSEQLAVEIFRLQGGGI